jgi:hypothetical protein
MSPPGVKNLGGDMVKKFIDKFHFEYVFCTIMLPRLYFSYRFLAGFSFSGGVMPQLFLVNPRYFLQP